MSEPRRVTVGHVRPARARAPIIPGKLLDKLVIETLAAAELPLPAYDIAEHLRGFGHHIAMMSLYRSLDRLCAHKRVEKIATISAFRIRDVPSAVLMICINCGATVPLDVATHYEALENAVAGTGFAIGKLAIEATGLCNNCNEQIG